ncbi:MAG: DegT/DnrJ/EryC1/StrS family aminotransferase [Planctomycetaceae bacterium]|nr:DegT/DnrJ/EryC1/StrS family aminotransferase [Planctomycetaceae bacterium]
MAVASTHSDQPPVPFIDLVAQYHTIKDQVRRAVDQVFETQQFVLGDEVRLLEEEIAQYCDARYAIGCASGTDALVLSLLALGVGPGDEVITSPFTFFATAGAIHRVGAVPRFVDIEPVTYNLNAELVEEAINEKTKAIIPVHIFGQCADMESLWRISVRHNLPIVEDACQAIGAEYRGRRAGVLGTVGCFSFFPTKNLGGAGDGGIITTDDAEVAARLKRLRVHGDVGGYTHVEVGFNSRLDALQAAVLRVKLQHLDSWSDARRRNAKRYNELLREADLLSAVDAPAVAADQVHVYNQYTLRIKGGRRDQVMKYLRGEGVGCAVYYPISLHMQECFSYLGCRAEDYPESTRASAEVLSLPIFSELTDAQLQRVVNVLQDATAEITTLKLPDVDQTSQRRAA